MKSKKVQLSVICILINLIIGNLALLMFPDISFAYRIIISAIITAVYSVVFYKLDKVESKAVTKWQLAGISILLSLFGMLTACIFTSVGIRLPMDDVISAAIKGIIPMFVFALFLGSPFWIPLALVNFICLNYLRRDQLDIK